MAFNGVAKSAVKASSKQDYMNLLYSDSDSDHVPDLKLPPVKGKKQRRKKSSANFSKEDGGCSAMCVFKTILVLLICATLVILAGLCVWTLQRVSDLQEQVRTMQSSDQGKSDLGLLQTQVKDIENSLKELKKSDGILEDLNTKVLDISARLRKVESTTEKLNQSVIAAQSLLNTPKQLKSLTDFVASFKSDLVPEQKAQKTKLLELEQRLSTLEARQLENAPLTAEKKNSVDTQFGGMLSQQISEVNETASSAILSVKEQLHLFQGRLSALESYTQSKEEGLGHDEVEGLVLALIQEKLNNLTFSSVNAPVDEITNGSSSELHQVFDKVNHLTQLIDSKSDFAENMDLVSKGDFIFFQGDILMKFENVNKTVFAFSAEFDSLMHRLETIEEVVRNVSFLVVNGNRDTNQNEKDVLEGSDSDIVAPTESPVKDIVEPTALPEATSSGNSEEIKQELGPGLHIEGIETVEDLHKAFMDQWPQDNGQINMDVVLSLLNNNSTESAVALQTFDTNVDGRFSEEELQNALGLQDRLSPRR